MKNYVLVISSVIVLLIIGILFVNFQSDKQKNETLDQEKEETSTIDLTGKLPNATFNADDFEATLEKSENNEFLYTVTNVTDKKITVPFGSSQRYQYVVKEQEGKVVYDSSAEMLYNQALGEEILQPGEKLQYEFVVKDLEAGTYEVEVWLTSMSEHQFKKKETITVK